MTPTVSPSKPGIRCAEIRLMSLIVRAALTISLASAAHGATPASPKASEPHSASQQATPPRSGTESDPLVVNVKTLPQPSQAELEDRAAERKEKTDSDWWLIKLTGGLVVATIALAIVTTFLWIATRRLVIDAKESSQRQLRAYVSVDTEHMTDSAGNTIPNRHGFVITNHGQTPAHELEHWTQLGVSEFPLKQGLGEPGQDRLIVKTVVHPGNDRLIIEDMPLLPEELVAIEAGTHAWYAWGCVNYTDVFGQGHSTKFCFFVNKDALVMQRWAHYKEGNEAT